MRMASWICLKARKTLLSMCLTTSLTRRKSSADLVQSARNTCDWASLNMRLSLRRTPALMKNALLSKSSARNGKRIRDTVRCLTSDRSTGRRNLLPWVKETGKRLSCKQPKIGKTVKCLQIIVKSSSWRSKRSLSSRERLRSRCKNWGKRMRSQQLACLRKLWGGLALKAQQERPHRLSSRLGVYREWPRLRTTKVRCLSWQRRGRWRISWKMGLMAPSLDSV